jgi:hypothetical protein
VSPESERTVVGAERVVDDEHRDVAIVRRARGGKPR